MGSITGGQSWVEREGKLHWKGTVATEAEKNEIWTAKGQATVVPALRSTPATTLVISRSQITELATANRTTNHVSSSTVPNAR